VLARPDVGLGGANKLWSFPDFPEKVQDKEDWNIDVGDNEALHIKFANEHIEAVEDNDYAEVDKSEPSSVWLIWRLEDEGVSIDILSNESFSEAEVGNANANPCEKLGDGSEILEPGKDSLGTATNDHVGEERDSSSDGYTVNGDTLLSAFEEDFWGLTVLGNTEEITGAGVQESVGRR